MEKISYMGKKYYTSERNVQIVIALLKTYGIRKVIASPGTTNMTFIGSIQNDPFFEIYSSVDERSAAYIACGLAVESGEPVVISCTGATASRNYMSGLTEAYYRKIPVLAITSHRGDIAIGHLLDQQIDRRSIPNDIAMESVTVPLVKETMMLIIVVFKQLRLYLLLHVMVEVLHISICIRGIVLIFQFKNYQLFIGLIGLQYFRICQQ